MKSNKVELVKQISHGVYVIGVSECQYVFTAAWVMHWRSNYWIKACFAIAEHFGRSAKDKMADF
jgi:hypothetical protein